MKVKIKGLENKIIPIVLVVIGILFFVKFFVTDISIQAPDSPLGWVKYVQTQTKANQSVWASIYWMGQKIGQPVLDFNNFAQFIVSDQFVLPMIYMLSVIFAMLFMYFLLRRLKIAPLVAGVGGLVYAFIPNILSLIFSGHTGVIGMLPWPPAMFLFLTIAFDKDETGWKKWVAAVVAGICWGLTMQSAVQRGVYYSLFGAVYILYMVIKNREPKLKTFVKDVLTKDFAIEIGRAILVGVFLFLTFLAPLQSFGGSVTSGEHAGATSTVEIEKKINDLSKTPNRSAADNQKLEKLKAEYKVLKDRKVDETWAFNTSFSFHPSELIDSIAFGYHGRVSSDSKNPYWGMKGFAGNTTSLGYFILLFAIIGIGLNFRKNGVVRVFSIVGGVALLLSFGGYWPGMPFYWLFSKLPMMSKFRAPEKFLTITAFAFTVLAAYGLNSIFTMLKEKKEGLEKKLDVIMISLAVFLGLGLIWMFVMMAEPGSLITALNIKFGNNFRLVNAAKGGVVSALLRMNIFTLLSIGIVFLCRYFKGEKAVAFVFIGLFGALMVYDFISIDRYFISMSEFKPKEVYRTEPGLDFFTKDMAKAPFRLVMTLKETDGKQWRPHNIFSFKRNYITYLLPYFSLEAMDVTAMSRVEPEYNEFFLRTLMGSITNQIRTFDGLLDANLRLYRLANVKYLLSDANIQFSNTNVGLVGQVPLSAQTYYNVYQLKDTLPRVAFYENYLTVKSNDKALSFISDKRFDIQKLMVLEGEMKENIVQTTNMSRLVALTPLEYKPWYLKVQYHATNRGAILHTTRYTPQWKAYVNGKKVKVNRANYIQQGITLEPGDYTIEFKYEEENRPLLISLITALVGLIFALVIWIVNPGKKEKIEE